MRILYIDIDSLRPDHLGCYGYHRNTSPCIDQLATQGVRFTRLFASDSPCLPSRTAFFCGRPGSFTGVVNHGGKRADLYPEGDRRGFRSAHSLQTLGSALRHAGYHTASISPFPQRHSAYQIIHGFHETYDTGKGGLENADEVYPVASDWIARHGKQENWFLHVNFWDPHTPYDTPESFGNPFEQEPIGDWLTQGIIDCQRASFGPHSAREVPGYDDKLPAEWRWGVGEIRDLQDAKVHIDGYDTGIRYVDMYVERLLDDLDKAGILSETVIYLSADHGENQGELNVWGDHQTADLITNGLPGILIAPGIIPAGKTYDGFCYHMDLATTLLEIAGAKKPDSWFGNSLLKDIQSNRPIRNSLILSQGAWSCQRAALWDRWLLIRTYHAGWKDFPPYMLFDIEADRHETRNLAQEREDLMAVGLRLLDEWQLEIYRHSRHGDPFCDVIQEGGPLHANRHSPHFATYVQRLIDTGRGELVERLE